MDKKHVLISVMLLFTLSAFAQEIEVNVPVTVKITAGPYPLQDGTIAIYAHDNSSNERYMVYKQTDGSYTGEIRQYDNEHNLLEATKLSGQIAKNLFGALSLIR